MIASLMLDINNFWLMGAPSTERYSHYRMLFAEFELPFAEYENFMSFFFWDQLHYAFCVTHAGIALEYSCLSWFVHALLLVGCGFAAHWQQKCRIQYIHRFRGDCQCMEKGSIKTKTALHSANGRSKRLLLGSINSVFISRFKSSHTNTQ